MDKGALPWVRMDLSQVKNSKPSETSEGNFEAFGVWQIKLHPPSKVPFLIPPLLLIYSQSPQPQVINIKLIGILCSPGLIVHCKPSSKKIEENRFLVENFFNFFCIF